MNRALTTSSKYSPGNMAVEALESLFVARNDLLESTLSSIADTARSVATRYFLLVGPRGAGKTHFTSLLHHQLSAGSKYEEVRERSVIAYFNEEEWGIASYLDFLIRILVVLDEQSGGKLNSHLRDIRKLFSRSETKAIIAAEDALKQFVGDKRLILICENLNDLLEGLGTKGQQQWRSFTQQNHFWIVFATSPRISAYIQSQKAPFYGQFTIRYLERLRFEDAVELLIRKSTLDRKFELANFLHTATGRARVRAIHHLAGGNPRVYIVLSEFLTRESLDDLFEPFLQMADDLTPYYQDRLRQLAPRQRKIVEHLSRLGRPAKIKNIAEACLLTQQTASKQIHELAKQGYVLRIKAGRNTYVELTEPLMRICVEIKDNRTKHLRLFVEFLRHWFSTREIKTRCTLLAPDHYAGSQRVTALHLKAAMEECERSTDNPFIEALEDEAWKCYEASDYSGFSGAYLKLADERGQVEDYEYAILGLRKSGDLARAIETAELAEQEFPAYGELHYEKAMAFAENGQLDEALKSIDVAISLGADWGRCMCERGDVLMRLGRYEEVISNEDEHLRLDPNHAQSVFSKSLANERMGKFEDALMEAELLVERDPDKQLAWARLAFCLLLVGRKKDALDAIDRIRIDADTPARCHITKAEILDSLGRIEEAIEVYMDCLEDSPASVETLCKLSQTLVGAAKYEDAIAYSKRLLELEPDHTHAYVDLAKSCLELGRKEEAVKFIHQLAEFSDKNTAAYLAWSAELLAEHSRPDDALYAIDSAITIDSSEVDFLIIKAEILLAMDNAAETLAVLQTARDCSPEDKRVDNLWVAANVAESGMQGFKFAVQKFGIRKTADFPEVNWRVPLVQLIGQQFLKEGPIGIATSIKQVLEIVPIDDIGEKAAEALTEYCFQKVGVEVFTAEGWDRALPLLKESLSDFESCNVTLEFLSVAVEYSSSRDEEALLQLPVEQRELLLTAFNDPESD